MRTGLWIQDRKNVIMVYKNRSICLSHHKRMAGEYYFKSMVAKIFLTTAVQKNNESQNLYSFGILTVIVDG